ncbi:MAG: cell envelope integrity protein CreD [Chitinophagaceae bacterium]
MNSLITKTRIAASIWFLTCAVFAMGWLVYGLTIDVTMMLLSIVAFVFAVLGSIPVFIVLLLTIPWINTRNYSIKTKKVLLYFICFICITPYGIIGGFIFSNKYDAASFFENILYILAVSLTLFICSLIAILINNKLINNYFSQSQNNHFMEQNQFQDANNTGNNLNTNDNINPSENWRKRNPEPNTSNKTLFKGIVTGALILLMLIPTFFVSGIVSEREKRQQDVVKEVTNGWSTQQTLSGPYLYIPYEEKIGDEYVKKDLFLIPENLNVNGTIIPEIRPRSIYKILLYRSDLKTNGNFKIQLPKDIEASSLQLNEAKICYNLSDFKGIEERLNINFNGVKYDLSPGLPTKQTETITVPTSATGEEYNRTETTTKNIESIGLSANVNLTLDDLQKLLNFDMSLKIKGSERLHFIPLSSNSNFSINSTWKDPKFDGNSLPSTREVNQTGFQAKWNFNSANLPFGTAINDFNFNKQNLAFGVSMVQPADQYAKTMRSVKYAILFIGLTFALFFIIELMQKKPMHPVQYVLIGIALVIFFTLLLSISEFILFDYAYLIAALATVSLITLYAKSHFKSFKTASVFGSLLTCLYAFIFVLIRLEDAALLVGSIGLFIILALIMFGSRKINWYGTEDIKQ